MRSSSVERLNAPSADSRRWSSYRISRWLFLRLLGVVFLAAFASLWVQVQGLVGADGILPLGDYLRSVHDRLGAEAYRLLPTLTWICHSDAALQALCAGGVALALLLIAGMAPGPVLVAAWAVYLSLQISGQRFLGFQWDALLLESALCAWFYAPSGWRPRPPGDEPEPPAAGRWLLWLLLFKLMFLSGAVKLICLDDTWWQLTALDYHYFTTCLPLWTGWYAHLLPAWMQKLSVLGMFLVELGAPLAIFGPRRLRHAAGVALILLQLAIAATGSYGFFNLLTLVLCVPLFDDAFLARWLPRRRPAAAEAPCAEDDVPPSRPRRLGRLVRVVAVALVLLASALTFARELVVSRPPQGLTGVAGQLLDAADLWLVEPGEPLLGWIAPLRSINGYGLFRAMTTRRPEIVIEASMDGEAWREWEFRWKPGDPRRRPRWVAPHMPRLDWQIWFAALNPQANQGWLQQLLLRLFEGSPPVTSLLGPAPYAAGPPRYLRLAYYEYEFTDSAERRESGAWWRRTLLGYLTPPLSIEMLRPTAGRRG